MSAEGVILAPTIKMAEQLKSELGLGNWVLLSPRSIQLGRGRGISCGPKLIILLPVVGMSVDVMLNTCRDELLPMFAPEVPRMYTMTRHLLTYGRMPTR